MTFLLFFKRNIFNPFQKILSDLFHAGKGSCLFAAEIGCTSSEPVLLDEFKIQYYSLERLPKDE